MIFYLTTRNPIIQLELISRHMEALRPNIASSWDMFNTENVSTGVIKVTLSIRRVCLNNI